MARVRVYYKSGHIVDVECERFTVKKNPLSEAAQLEWVNAKPNPLLIGANDIESVWELGVRDDADD